MRKPPPPRPRGSPKIGGRRKGTPNRRTVEARLLCSNLVHDVGYQARLRKDFLRRRLHPSIESMVWAYHLGRPKTEVEMTGNFTMNQRLEAERQLIRSTLDRAELELLAEQSQRLLDDALARARASGSRARSSTPSHTIASDHSVDAESPGRRAGWKQTNLDRRIVPSATGALPSAVLDCKRRGSGSDTGVSIFLESVEAS